MLDYSYTIDPKYKTQAMSVLSDDEKIREVTKKKHIISIEIFEEDFQFAKQEDLNISRILRFKFHEWLNSKKMVIDHGIPNPTQFS